MTDLIDRMRTCAAHILATIPDEQSVLVRVTRHAADLLIEASNIIEAACEPYRLGEPMEIIPPPDALSDDLKRKIDTVVAETEAKLVGAWIAPGGPLPGLTQSGTVSPRVCPRCDSRAGKRVYRQDNHLMLACPVCGHTWEFKR